MGHAKLVRYVKFRPRQGAFEEPLLWSSVLTLGIVFCAILLDYNASLVYSFMRVTCTLQAHFIAFLFQCR